MLGKINKIGGGFTHVFDDHSLSTIINLVLFCQWAFTQCCEDELSGSDLSDIEEITSHRPEVNTSSDFTRCYLVIIGIVVESTGSLKIPLLSNIP